MKKQYMKPGIIIEDFRISEHISTCGVPGGGTTLGKPNHWSNSTCGWALDDTTILWVGEPICNEKTGIDEDVGGICYNTPSNGYSIFSS